MEATIALLYVAFALLAIVIISASKASCRYVLFGSYGALVSVNDSVAGFHCLFVSPISIEVEVLIVDVAGSLLEHPQWEPV